MTSGKSYVYAILVDGVNRYIGKGTGKRVKDHMWQVRSVARRRAAGEVVKTQYLYNRLASVWLKGCEIEEVILFDGLSDEEAFALETQLISKQRKQLWNMASGGRGLTSEVAKAVWENNKTAKASIASSNRRRMKDPVWAAKTRQLGSELANKVNSDPEITRRRIESIKRYWAERRKCQSQ
jgi:hypothetical protein